MALPTSTHSSYTAIGNRESLADIIYNISPEETPFISSIPHVSASAVYHEHQTDSLAAAASNAVLEGDDATTTAAVPTVRIGNYCQISDKVPRVTGTQRVVNSAGRGDELDYQIMKMGKELKRDMEFALVGLNNAKVAGNATTARECGSVLSYIATNDDLGAAGSPASPTGTGVDARTDGTQRAFAEADLETVLAGCWDSGGNPDSIMLGSFNKQAMSAFTGNATRNIDNKDKTLIASIDIYVGDFGQLAVRANRFQRGRDALVIDTDMWALATLRAFQEVPLSKTGDSDRVQLISEYTLESRNEAASGMVADLTTS